MSYITEQQLIHRFGEDELTQLTDREQLGMINTEVLNEAINDATYIINSKLKNAGFTLPIPQPTIDTSPLIRCAGDITRYLLMEDRTTATATKRYDDAMQWLSTISINAL